jgi:hypothetical protein
MKYQSPPELILVPLSPIYTRSQPVKGALVYNRRRKPNTIHTWMHACVQYMHAMYPCIATCDARNDPPSIPPCIAACGLTGTRASHAIMQASRHRRGTYTHCSRRGHRSWQTKGKGGRNCQPHLTISQYTKPTVEGIGRSEGLYITRRYTDTRTYEHADSA